MATIRAGDATHGAELDAGQAIASLARRLDHPADIERQETLIALHRNAELRLRAPSVTARAGRGYLGLA